MKKWLVLLLLIIGCGCSSRSNADEELTIFAAAQLQEAFIELQTVFEKKEDIKVSLNFAGSQALRTQIEQGAPADLFASANLEHISDLKDKGIIEESFVFSQNKLALIAPKSNPANIENLSDLAQKQHRLVIGNEHAPIGIYTRQLLEKANEKYGESFADRVIEHVVSLETDTKKVLGKVVLGEADAGFVYVTDITEQHADKLLEIEIIDELNVITKNSIAIINNDNDELARKWIDFLLSDEGQQIMAKHKFMTRNEDENMDSADTASTF